VASSSVEVATTLRTVAHVRNVVVEDRHHFYAGLSQAMTPGCANRRTVYRSLVEIKSRPDRPWRPTVGIYDRSQEVCTDESAATYRSDGCRRPRL
jgi:hypothetical protein